MEKEYDFIINPKARSGMGMKAWQKIESELKARHINYRVYLTKEEVMPLRRRRLSRQMINGIRLLF